MNIIFAVQNNNGWESDISSRFGRTEGYICYSDENNEISYHSNEENVNAGHGAGIQAGQIVIGLKADVVIAGGDIGPKAFQVLKGAGVKMYCQIGEIKLKEALESFKNGKYLELSESGK
ncbi:MAG: hypothetical protein JEZ03_16530, partial [Bacteroidales bacterium]|nr:hypothetical protein [Bacteroidales bacterium]